MTRATCPHCHKLSTLVECRKCGRVMCDECISAGDFCGLCADEEEKLARRRLSIRDEYRKGTV